MPAAFVPEVWPAVQEWLEASLLGDSRCAIGDVYAQLAAARATLWVVQRGAQIVAAVVTRPEVHPRSTSMGVWLCGGSGLWEWVDLLGVIEAEARSQGYAHVEIQGRRGWARVLPGYRERAVLLEKEL